ncbi:nucleotidyltransferase family protein [Pseudomonadota bacterium]
MAAEISERLLNDLNSQIDDFLCRALRGEPALWPALNPVPDPDVFLIRCQHQGVTSLLYHGMREKEEWLGWPAEICTVMEDASKGQVAQEMLRAHYLRKLLKGFSDAAIPHLLTKGEALANTIYPIPGTRTRADSDVFIAIEDIGKARQAIIDNDFRIVSPIYKSHQFVVRQAKEATVSFDIDVHWRILNAPQFARTLSFAEAYGQSVEVPGMHSVRTLGRVDSLLLACMHRAGSDWHDRDRLIWIYDMHLLVAVMAPAELAAFAEKAVNHNVQAVCLDGLNRTSEFFGTLFPKSIAARLAAPEIRGLATRFVRSNLALLIDDWRALPDSHARMSLLHELFLPNNEALLHKYHKQKRWWLPLLYLRHVLGGITHRITLK